jgi:hypothetical protein
MTLSVTDRPLTAEQNGPCHHPDCNNWIKRYRTLVVNLCGEQEHFYHHPTEVMSRRRAESRAKARRLAPRIRARAGA